MEWNFTANSSEELAKIGDKLLNASRQTFLDEQWQLSRLLEALSSKSIFKFPVRVRHTGEQGVPDFQIDSGGQRIGIELAKVTLQDVEHARGLQRNGLKQTIEISSLYHKSSKPRTSEEVLKEALPGQAWSFGVSPSERRSIWIEEMGIQMDEKTATIQGSRFDHGDEDWLVLWNRILIDESEIQSRIEILKSLLTTRWKPQGWYSRVLLQQTEWFPFVAILSKAGITLIPDNCEIQKHKYPSGFTFSGSPED